jgi:hypothetical protein
MAESHAKERLESLARHLTSSSTGQKEKRAKFELDNHTVDYVRPLRVSFVFQELY